MTRRTEIRRKALSMALVLFAVCLSFSFPALLDDSGAEAPGRTIVVPDIDSRESLEETILDYARLSSEVRHLESMGHNVSVVDPGVPDSEPERKVVERMREMIGSDRFVPDDRHEQPPGMFDDSPPDERPEPPAERPGRYERIEVDSSEAGPDPSFVEEVADFMDSTGDARLAEVSKHLRGIPWSILMELNESFVATTSAPADRKDGEAETEDDVDDFCMEEKDEEPESDIDPEESSPTPCTDTPAPSVDRPFHYMGVTSSGQTF